MRAQRRSHASMDVRRTHAVKGCRSNQLRQSNWYGGRGRSTGVKPAAGSEIVMGAFGSGAPVRSLDLQTFDKPLMHAGIAGTTKFMKDRFGDLASANG